MSLALAYSAEIADPVVLLKANYVRRFGFAAAALLCQIEYWYKPDKNGKPKLRVQRDGAYWLVKTHIEFEHEIGLSRRQLDTALKQLTVAGILATSLHRFNGTTTRHIRATIAEGRAVCTRTLVVLPEVQPDAPVGATALHGTVQCITESTSQTTTESLASQDNTGVIQEVQPREKVSMCAWEKKVRAPLPADSAKAVLANFQAAKGKPPKVTKESIGGQFYEVWRYEVPKHTSTKIVVPFTQMQYGQANLFVNRAGNRWEQVLRYVLQHWIEYVKYTAQKAGIKHYPTAPNIAFIGKYAQEAMNFHIAETSKPSVPLYQPSAINCKNDTPAIAIPQGKEHIVTAAEALAYLNAPDDDEE